MKSFLFLSCALTMMAGAQTPMAKPVVVELFTSEGCSSCPPADHLLAQLDEKQPISGVQIIVLSEHVDYWNSQGWKDPYSAEQYSERQRKYSLLLRTPEVYTPQAVIDGRWETVGGNGSNVMAAIQRAAKEEKTPIELHATREGNTIHIQVSAKDVKRGADVYLAIAEDEVKSQVSAGENNGRMLAHVAVVRSLKDAGKLAADGQLKTDLKTDPNWGGNRLRVIAFVAEHNGGRISGAAAAKL